MIYTGHHFWIEQYRFHESAIWSRNCTNIPVWIKYFKFQICCIDYRFWFYSTFIQPNFAWITWISLALNIRNPLNNFGFSFAIIALIITQPQTLRLLITPVQLYFCYGLKLAINISAVHWQERTTVCSWKSSHNFLSLTSFSLKQHSKSE